MPGTDGITATGRIALGDESPRVLVLTTFDQDEYVFDARSRARRQPQARQAAARLKAAWLTGEHPGSPSPELAVGRRAYCLSPRGMAVPLPMSVRTPDAYRGGPGG